MDSPSQPKHIVVHAFVGVFGAGPQRHKERRTVCGRTTSRFSIGSVHVTFVGRGDEPEEIHESVDDIVLHTGRPFLDDRLFETGAIPMSDELDGKFALLQVTPHGLELITDFLGAGSVYYALEGGLLYFSSHLGLLIEALPQVPALNDSGVAAQLLALAQLFDETHFSGTYRLAAGGRLTAGVTPSGTVDVRKTRGNGIEGLLDIDVPRFTKDTFRALLDIGVERERYDADSVLMLSGGRDSLAIALSRAPRPGLASSYGEPYSIDFLRGKQRAGRLGFEFLAVPYQDWTLETYRDEIVGLHAGCAGLQTAHNIVAFDWVSDKANLAAVGYLGDVFKGKFLAKVDGDYDESDVLQSLLKKVNDPTLNDLFPTAVATIAEYAMDTFRDMERDLGPHKAILNLKLRWQQARWLSITFDLCDWYLPVSYPFMQRSLIASWFQADIDDLGAREIVHFALEEALAERGLVKDYRGGVPERLWNRIHATVPAFCRGRRVFNLKKGEASPNNLCDWQSVIARSKFSASDGICRYHSLSEVTRRSWQRALSGADRSPTPSAYLSATIAAATERAPLR